MMLGSPPLFSPQFGISWIIRMFSVPPPPLSLRPCHTSLGTRSYAFSLINKNATEFFFFLSVLLDHSPQCNNGVCCAFARHEPRLLLIDVHLSPNSVVYNPFPWLLLADLVLSLRVVAVCQQHSASREEMRAALGHLVTESELVTFCPPSFPPPTCPFRSAPTNTRSSFLIISMVSSMLSQNSSFSSLVHPVRGAYALMTCERRHTPQHS